MVDGTVPVVSVPLGAVLDLSLLEPLQLELPMLVLLQLVGLGADAVHLGVVSVAHFAVTVSL